MDDNFNFQMTEQLKGKIYWVLDDFAYIGSVASKKDSTVHIAARVEHVIIAEHMIKFFVCSHKSLDGTDFSYNVNLQINETGSKYVGFFTEGEVPDHRGEVSCELFSNLKRHFLYGRWVESEVLFTFWVVIDRNQENNR